MNQVFPTLLLGLILGVEHAFEADHMIAVSNLMAQHQNPVKASLVGTFWGIGHTTTLFIIGILVLLLKVQIPPKLSLSFEFLVGVMLVFLGYKTLRASRHLLHIHLHRHKGTKHAHPHIHSNPSHLHHHHKSFLIGLVHGLAGSGALTILVLSTIRDTIAGIYYILVFGLGSIFGMTLMSAIFGLPFIFTIKKLPVMEIYLKIIAGTLSIVFGLFVIYQIGFVESLLTRI